MPRLPLPPRVPAAVLISVVLLFAGGCAGGSGGPVASTDTAGSPPASPAPSHSPRPAAFPLTIADDDGVEVTLAEPPARIVTFAPSATEVVFALGMGDEVVGVSGPFDDYPPAARSVTEVGGAGQFGVDPNVEKIVSLDPDIVLAIEGGDQWKDRLRKLGVPVFTTDSTDFDDLLHDIRTVGRVTGVPERAAALTAGMAARERAVEASAEGGPSRSCFFEISYDPLFTVGPGSFIFDLLRRAGCDPVSADARDAYPQWSVEQLVADDPDVYLVSSESGGTVAQVERRPGYDALSAVRHHRVFLVDSDLVSRAGPRAVEGLEALAAALAPER